MAYNTKKLKTDLEQKPNPQYYNPTIDDYEPLEGQHGAAFATLKDKDGNIISPVSPDDIIPLNTELTLVKAELQAIKAGQIDGTQIGKVMTQKPEVVAYAYDKIIDVIGPENIVCFLPCWETEGTVLTDLLNPEIKFNLINSGQLGYQGPLHSIVQNSDVLPALKLAPQYQQTPTTANTALTASGKLAHKIPAGGLRTAIGSVWLSLGVVGTLSSAKIKVSIHEDYSGSVGTLVCSSKPQRASMMLSSNSGFSFSDHAYNLNRPYWIVLEYDDATGVDESNYVYWRSGSGTTDRAVYDGSWTIVSGESHSLEVYNNYFTLPPENTTIFGGINLNPPGDWTLIRFYHAYGSDWGSTDYFFETNSLGKYSSRCGAAQTCDLFDELKQYSIIATTLDKDTPYDKQRIYVNGRLRAEAISGHTETGMDGIYSPVYLAHRGNLAMGPYILVNQPLTARQIASVSSYLTMTKKFGGIAL